MEIIRKQIVTKPVTPIVDVIVWSAGTNRKVTNTPTAAKEENTALR